MDASSQSPPTETTLQTFPKDPSEFDADPRISFSKLDQKFILETEAGEEYEFDEALKRWVPVVRNNHISFLAKARYQTPARRLLELSPDFDGCANL